MPVSLETNKYERVLQIYNWLRTARLNVLYYEESQRNWRWIVRGHDILIALTGASSPIAFWKHSNEPIQQQAWFYLTLIAGIAAILKPILRLEKQLVLFTELTTHYCTLYLDLKYLCEDITYARDFSSKHNAQFEHYRQTFRTLGQKEPPQDERKTLKLQARVNKEIDINNRWFPREEC